MVYSEASFFLFAVQPSGSKNVFFLFLLDDHPFKNSFLPWVVERSVEQTLFPPNLRTTTIL